MAKVKLIDVAQKAGVSKSTVSQFLNGRFDYMSEKTKERIQGAVDDLNYVPNSIARSLKTNKTKTIGVIVRDITGYYTSRAIRGIDDYCKSHGYNVVIYNTDFDSEIEAKALQDLNKMAVDGVIITPSGNNMALLYDYEKKGLPVVQIQIEYDDIDKNIIVSDYKQAAYEATTYLISLGHKRIGFLTQDFDNVKSRQERYLGYKQALLDNNIDLQEDLIQYWSREKGFEMDPVLQLEKLGLSAFFPQHLAITTELLTCLNQNEVTVPEQVSLIGFDELPMADFFKVPITVIKQPAYDIGEKAAETLLNNLTGKTNGSKKVTVPCSLVKRKSCQSVIS